MAKIQKTNNFEQMMNQAQYDDKKSSQRQESMMFANDNNCNAMNMQQKDKEAKRNENEVSYYIVREPWEVEKLSKSIMASAAKETPILGIDCEGLAKTRRMQLI